MLVLLAVWLADVVPAWLAGDPLATPVAGESDAPEPALAVVLVTLSVWLTDAVTWVAGVAWLAVASELVVLAAWLVLACDLPTPPVADEPDTPEPALGVVLVTLSVWFAVTWVAGVAWLATWLLLPCDPLTTPVADESALGVVAAWATGAWLARL